MFKQGKKKKENEKWWVKKNQSLTVLTVIRDGFLGRRNVDLFARAPLPRVMTRQVFPLGETAAGARFEVKRTRFERLMHDHRRRAFRVPGAPKERRPLRTIIHGQRSRYAKDFRISGIERSTAHQRRGVACLQFF